MADKAISELIAANQVTPTDLFVLEQSGTAKKLTGQTLENWLLSFADGHGGIHSIVKNSTSGLNDTYRITFADTTTFDFVVTNGKAISSVSQTSVDGLTREYTIAFNDGTSQTFNVTDGRSITDIAKTGTNGLADTYTIRFNDGTTSKFGVTNGAKGDKGDNTYTHIKFASQEPTEASHSVGDVPDKWIGFYWGNSSTAPTDWTQYKWYQFKGDKGDTGSPATLTNSVVEYQVGNSGTTIPSEAWSVSVPVVAQGKYLWTRITQMFNTGSPVVSYSVARMGLDGAGSVVSVNNVSPNENGNVVLNPEDVRARPDTWMPSVADIGAAPASYGLGEGVYDSNTCPKITTVAGLNTATKCGWYACAFGDGGTAAILNNITIWNAVMFVSSYIDSRICQELYVTMDAVKLTRWCYNGTWTPWECDNPPMVLGVEYRTSRRIAGKSVYAKFFNMGNCPVGETSVKIADNVGTWAHIVALTDASGNDITISGYVNNARTIAGNIVVNMSAATTLLAVIEYIKSTD